MRVSIDISGEYREPYAVIHTDRVTDEIRRIMDIFSSNDTPIRSSLPPFRDLITPWNV